MDEKSWEANCCNRDVSLPASAFGEPHGAGEMARRILRMMLWWRRVLWGDEKFGGR